MTPVCGSPLMMAQLIGAAPRYCGSSEACRLIVPIGGMFHTCVGSMRNATTICRSAWYVCSWLRNVGSVSFCGCRMGRLFCSAYCLTGLCCRVSWCRPTGLSGVVTTATML